MTAPRLQPADMNVIRRSHMDYTHHMHISHTIHNILQKNKLCKYRIAFYWRCEYSQRQLRRYDRAKPAVPLDFFWKAQIISAFQSWISSLDKTFLPNSDQNSDSTKLFDLRSPHPGLCVTVYPDGGNRPVGVCCSTTSAVSSRKPDHPFTPEYN